MYRVPKGFCRRYLRSLCDAESGIHLDDDLLAALEKTEEGSVRNMFYYAHDLAPDSERPVLCLNKHVWRNTYSAVHAHLGHRMKSLVLLRRGGKVHIDWNKFGHYELLPGQGFPKTHVRFKHLNMQASLDGFEQITGEFKILHNHSWQKAGLKHKKKPQCVP